MQRQEEELRNRTSTPCHSQGNTESTHGPNAYPLRPAPVAAAAAAGAGGGAVATDASSRTQLLLFSVRSQRVY
ncbi:hypothetical protein SK128_025997, partial [Halocaridina rubra]